MTTSPSTTRRVSLLRVPFFAPAVLAILLAMLAEAMGFSYLALLAVEKVGMAPLELGVFLSLSSVSGIVAMTVFGHLHDRRPGTWPLLVSLVAKAAGFGLCAVVTETWILFLNAAVLFGIGSASFALLFAMAKRALDDTDDKTISSGMAALRLGNSLSWAVGPALGAAAAAWWGLDAVYLGAAALAVLALAVVLISRIPVASTVTVREPITRDVLYATAPVVIALTAFHTAMFTGGNAMSIVVSQQLGSPIDVGLIFSVCAILEVAVMSVFVIRPATGLDKRLLLIGFAIFAVYHAGLVAWPSLPSFYVGQVLRAVAIAIISVIGMAYLQELLPGRAGMAAALFGSSASAAGLLSGLGTGLWAQSFGYMSLFSACAGLSLLGGAALWIRR